MSPQRSLLLGVKAVLLDNPDWRSFFNLRPNGLNAAFIAMGLTIIFFVLSVLISLRTSPEALANSGPAPDTLATTLLVGLYVAGFPLVAAAIAYVQDATVHLRAWIITRSFAVLVLAAFITAVFLLTLIGLPHGLARWPAMLLYIAILLVDIRIAQTVMEQGWVFSIFTGILIWIGSTLLVLGALAGMG